VLFTVVLTTAFTLGGVMTGYPLFGSLDWALARGPVIALLTLVPATLVVAHVPARIQLAAGVVAGVLGFGASLGAAALLGELTHHPWSEAVHHAEASLRDATRPSLLAATALIGAAAGASVGGRAGPMPGWVRRWGVGLLGLVLGLVAVAIVGAGVEIPRPLVLLVVAGLAVPLAQVGWLVLVLADALTFGRLPRVEPPDDGPRPELGRVDQLFAAMAGGGPLELVPVLAGVAAGIDTGSAYFGIPVGLVTWLLMKVVFALWSQRWVHRLARRDPERGVRYARYRAHAQQAALRRTCQADLIVALLAAGGSDSDEAAALALGLAQEEGLNVLALQPAIGGLIAAGQPAAALALLDACSPVKSKRVEAGVAAWRAAIREALAEEVGAGADQEALAEEVGAGALVRRSRPEPPRS